MLRQRAAFSALLVVVALIALIPIAAVGTLEETTHHETETTHHEPEPTHHETEHSTTSRTSHTSRRITTTFTTSRTTHTTRTYIWPPPDYQWPPPGYCDPNDPYSYCWNSQCAPDCGYQAVVTESGTTVMTSMVTSPPSTQMTTVVVTQLPYQPSPTNPAPDYTPIAIAIVAAAVIVGLALMRRRGPPSKPTQTAQPSPASSPSQPSGGFCPNCGTQLSSQANFCKKCGSSVTS